jgi:tetratricopeptide (TPR) repeat protein
MKRIMFVMLMVASVAAFAQKQQKPNINKALSAMRDKKMSEAKEIIDAATTYEKTMNDGKTWYYRGLIYSAIDTSSNESVRALDPNAFTVAMESFKKADQLGKKDSEYFTTDPNNPLPTTKTQQLEILSNYYLDKGIKQFQDTDDLEGSLASLEKTKTIFEGNLAKYPNDTLAYYVTGLVAQQAEKDDLAIASMNKYIEKGGKSKDAYLVLYQIANKKEDKTEALEVIRKAKAAIPSNPDFPKVEIGLLIDMGKEAEAKAGLEQQIEKEPDNKILHFYLGYINAKGGDHATARKNFQEAVRIDPTYYDAHFHLANTFLTDVDKVSKQLQATGNTPADSKKRSALVQQRVKESETAIPYLERVEKMKHPDKDSEIEVLQKLSLLYYYIADDKNVARVDKKLKALGVTD